MGKDRFFLEKVTRVWIRKPVYGSEQPETSWMPYFQRYTSLLLDYAHTDPFLSHAKGLDEKRNGTRVGMRPCAEEPRLLEIFRLSAEASNRMIVIY